MRGTVTFRPRRPALKAREAPAPWRFAGLEALRGRADVAVRELAAGRVWERPAPELLLDLSGEGTRHWLDGPLPSHVTAQAWVALPPAACVRGTLMVELEGRRLFLPRAAAVETAAAFTDQFRDAAGELHLEHRARPDGVFFSGLGWDAAGALTVAPTAEERLAGDVLWATPDEWDNWGAWLLQTLPAVVRAEREGFDGRLLCRVERPWQRAFLEALAPRLAGRLVPQDVGRAYRVEGRLHVLAQTLRNLLPTDADREAFAAVAQMARRLRPDAPAHERLFVSRLGHSLRNPWYRALENEPALIAALESRGFAAVEPEGLDLLSQAAMFARAEAIVGLGGAGMFNAVFCRPGASLMTVESSATWIEGHANIFASAGLRYAVVFGRKLEAGDHARWTLPLAPALEAVDRFVS